MGTKRGECYAASCTHLSPLLPWGGEAPSAQHPALSTQCPAPSAQHPACRAPQSFTLPLPTLTACGLRGSASSKTPGFGPGLGTVRGGAWPWRWKLVQHGADRQQHRMVSKEKREDETNQESRGVRASSGPGAGAFPPPPGEADRLQQRCWGADPTRKAAAQRVPER